MKSKLDYILLPCVYYLFVRGMYLLPSIKLHGIYVRPAYYMILFIVLFLVIKFIDKKPFSHYGLKKPKAKDFRLMLWFLFMLMPLAFIGRIVDPQFDHWYAQATGLNTFLGFLLFSAIMPFYVIKEEVVFRAIFQNRLRKYGFWWMAVSVSFAFAIAHYFPSDTMHVWVQVISVFIGSFILIAFFEMTRNLWLAVLLHLAYNIIISLQIFLHVAYPAFEKAFWIFFLSVFLFLILRFKGSTAHFRKGFHTISSLDFAFLVVFALIVPLLILMF